MDLFYYDNEEFHFHRGSLLLRGNNGTGKSKVLALMLPFLLDGELTPYRVEPDGDKGKKMEWNLLLGGKHPHPERLGYTWLEFGRRDTDGTEHYLTLGCGLKAATGRGITRHWFFVTSQRVGTELALLTPSGTALTRERLREAVGQHGLLYDRAGDYRRAIDEAMFGLGPRYESLVDLLIRLRQPQLTKRPDEQKLSQALTEALPPLDESLIAQVAEAFRSLDEERETLADLSDAKRSADDFLTAYRRYAQIAAKRAAASPRQLHSRYEQIGRDLGDAERQFTQADQAMQTAADLRTRLGAEYEELTAQKNALVSSPEARAADNLRRLAELATGLTELAQSHGTTLQMLTSRAAELERRLVSARTELEATTGGETKAHENAKAAAHAARVSSGHAERVVPALASAHPPFTSAAEAAQQLADRRASSLRQIKLLLEVQATAARLVQAARAAADRLASELATATEHITLAQEKADAQGTSLLAEMQTHLTTTVELRVADLDQVLAALEGWVETLDGDNPAERAITEAVTAATTDFARSDAALEVQERAATARIAELDSERQRLAEGGHEPPPQPHTRDVTARQARPGAPLWRVVDFAETVSDADRAGLEAALEAAGILDAWLSPDGELRDRITDDVILRPTPTTQPHLGAALRPVVGPADAAVVTEEAVSRALATVGLGVGQGTWVDTDGRFANGVLAGHWHKDTATHIGEGARERARRVRLRQLENERDELRAVLENLHEARADLAGRREVLLTEHRAVPSDRALREAYTLVGAAQQARRDLDRSLGEAQAHQRAAETALTERQAAVREYASDTGLPTDPEELDSVRAGLEDYRVALAALWPAAKARFDAVKAHRDADRDRTEAYEQIEPVAEAHAEADLKATEARQEHAALQATVGDSIAELETKLATVEVQMRGCAQARRTAETDERNAAEQRGTANGVRQTLTTDLDTVAEQRDSAINGFRSFTGTGLLALACPEVNAPDAAQPWTVTSAIQVARAVDRTLAEIDEAGPRWERSQQAITTGFKTLADSLSRYGHNAMMTLRENTMIVDVTFQGRTQPVMQLAASLVDEIAERQRLLSAREREVLETHLVNEVAGALQELVTTAESR
ncbi:uncharacterized protein (TIGR02680 family) [Allocatelliglobosispora scoriae]|uniref:Uncharacterized protein (TIGR02680 family) n=1 Tax=Allocatelliglobosispora scoriae TaxID=643052 RepID=A0A841BP46_9ACTN|nr:uncharacterized protein (TIGR02680 family) [Allocatelliglobosispora scoriae]